MSAPEQINLILCKSEQSQFLFARLLVSLFRSFDLHFETKLLNL